MTHTHTWHLTGRRASVSIELHQSDGLVIGASSNQVAVAVPGDTVDGTLVVFHTLDDNVHRLHISISSVVTTQHASCAL